MSDRPEPSPRPWRLEPNARRIFVDANGRYVGSCFVGEASALVVDAVNERDRLRDIVRQMAETLERVSRNYRFDFSELVREARAAIGEGTP